MDSLAHRRLDTGSHQGSRDTTVLVVTECKVIMVLMQVAQDTEADVVVEVRP